MRVVARKPHRLTYVASVGVMEHRASTRRVAMSPTSFLMRVGSVGVMVVPAVDVTEFQTVEKHCQSAESVEETTRTANPIACVQRPLGLERTATNVQPIQTTAWAYVWRMVYDRPRRVEHSHTVLCSDLVQLHTEEVPPTHANGGIPHFLIRPRPRDATAHPKDPPSYAKTQRERVSAIHRVQAAHQSGRDLDVTSEHYVASAEKLQ